MYIKVILNIILVIMLSVLQFSFISGLPGWLNNFNLILVVIIFLLCLAGLKLTLWWVIGAGIMLDILSFSPFGVFLISLILAALIVDLLQTNFFTNRSLYSFLALIFFFTLIYEFILNIIFYFLESFSSEVIFFILSSEYWLNLFSQIILNLIAVLIVFYIINFISDRLKPAFLIKKWFK